LFFKLKMKLKGQCFETVFDIQRLPLCYSGQSSWRYQIFWEIVGLEQGPLSLVSTIEELLGRKSSSSGLGSQEYGHRDLSRWPRGILYLQKLALTSPKSGGCSVGIVRSRTQATEFSLVFSLTSKRNCRWYSTALWKIQKIQVQVIFPHIPLLSKHIFPSE
jgi:hypothetical protein